MKVGSAAVMWFLTRLRVLPFSFKYSCNARCLGVGDANPSSASVNLSVVAGDLSIERSEASKTNWSKWCLTEAL